MERIVKWAIIGLGHRGAALTQICHNIVPQSKVVAVCDKIRALAEKTAQQLKTRM